MKENVLVLDEKMAEFYGLSSSSVGNYRRSEDIRFSRRYSGLKSYYLQSEWASESDKK